MKHSPDILGNTGLKFFGKISASISHELKNVLAIINESAGLLDDLAIMAPKGVPIDPIRLQTTAKRIQHQVLRADEIIQKMNRFSHTIDRDLHTVDIHDLLTSLLGLTKRLADMKGVAVSLSPKAAPVIMTTSPFFLKTLLWHLLDFAMGMLGESKTMPISVVKIEQTVEIRITQLDGLQTNQMDNFPGEMETALISSFGGELLLGGGSLLLKLPSNELY